MYSAQCILVFTLQSKVESVFFGLQNHKVELCPSSVTLSTWTTKTLIVLFVKASRKYICNGQKMKHYIG